MTDRSKSGSAPVRAVIFDLDGVLVDTAEYHFRAWKRLADELGVPFTRKDNERLKGVSRMESLAIILSLGDLHPSDEEKQRLADRKNGYYREHLKDMGQDDILPGVVPLLKGLREAGAKTAVASASKNAGLVVERVGLGRYFDAHAYGQDITHSKPDPELFLVSAKRLETPPAECVVVEDAAAGVEAAHRGRMRCVGVGKRDVLGEAELVVASLADLTAERVLAI